jgi:hypothetical protein
MKLKSINTYNLSLFIIMVIFHFACNQSSSIKSSEGKAQLTDTSELFPAHNETEEINEEEVKNTNIQFEELTVTIGGYTGNYIDHDLTKINKDTAFLFSELGSTIEGQLLVVLFENLSQVKVEQSYETSVTISKEGPHCDLLNWKHYYSEWKTLKINENGQFICEKYSQKDNEKFPKIEIVDLQQEVKKQCGDDWQLLINNIKSLTEYPSSVSISRYFLRVTGQRKDNGQLITKIIVIESPMGC